VTLGGESAGAINVCWLLASPLARGLFQAAVMESGGCDQIPTTPSLQQQLSQRLATAAGCSLPSSSGNSTAQQQQVSCMRALSAQQVWQSYLSILPNNLTSDFTFTPLLLRPYVDGYIVNEYPSNLLKSGNYNNVPVLLGDDHNEGALWAYGMSSTTVAMRTCLS
jgi:para-nitrobenzyl esterase